MWPRVRIETLIFLVGTMLRRAKCKRVVNNLGEKKWIRTLHLFDAFLTFPKTFAIHAGNRQREKEKDNDDDDDDDDDSDDDDSDDERESGVEKKKTTKSGFCRL